MPAAYLHGVETITLEVGPRPIQVVRSATIALIGIAPTGPAQQLVLVNNLSSAAQFGSMLPGFNIPQALDAILKQGGNGPIFVVNVFNETTHTTAISNETVVVANRSAKLAFAPVGATAPVVKDQPAAITYVAGTDYSIDAFGNITILSTAISDGDTLKVTYKRLNAGGVTSANIIGTINATSNVRTGSKLFELCYSLYGFTPKLLICPGFVTINAVATELIALADKYRAMALIDAPSGTTYAEALVGRGPAGTINFNTSSKRAVLCFPHVRVANPDPRAAANSTVLAPISQFLAGIISSTDLNNGYWFSPSNKELKGVLAVELALSAAINDANTDVNILNEKGILTVFNSYGTGLRVWGNRSAAFPTSTHPSNFISVQRTADVLNESVELAMQQFIDLPITKAVIDEIRASVNAFIRSLVSRGALIDGECTFDPDKNQPTDIAAGKLTFDLAFMPPTPAERITFESYIDIELLRSLIS